MKVYTGDPADSITPQLSWFNPFDLGWTALIDGVLLGVFIYWGWDSGVAVNEESEDSRRGARTRRGRLDDPARADLPRRLDGGAGVRRHETARRQLGRRAQRARRRGLRLAARQAADPRRADVGGGLDADDDPADRAHDAVDGAQARDPDALRERPSALPDAELLDDLDGRRLDRLDGLHHGASTRRRTCSATRSPRSASASASTTASPGSRASSTSAARSRRACATSCFAGLAPLLGFVMLAYIFGKAAHDYSQADFNYSRAVPRHRGADPDRHRRPAARRRRDAVRDGSLPRLLPPQAVHRGRAEPGLLEKPVEHAPAHLRGKRW